MREPRATIDFETRSVANLKKVGAWLYSKHRSTQILCLQYKLPGMEKPKLWHRAHPALGIKESAPPTDLLEWVAAGKSVEAHNAFFEFCIWFNIASLAYGWPELKLSQMRCSAAKAAACSLPRALEDAISAMSLPINKDPRGEALLKKYARPKKLNKEERKLYGRTAILFIEDEGLPEVWEYCGQDVEAEEGLSAALPDLSPMEQQLWVITQEMNLRGTLFDIELAHDALKLRDEAKAKANAELKSLTGIESGTQREAVKAWLLKHESLEVTNTQAKTLEWYLDPRRYHKPLSPRARRVLEIIKDVNRTSTTKYQRMLELVDTDQRARELVIYCGAERTGRYSGRGIQIQNLPKGRWASKALNMDYGCDDVKTLDLEWCEAIHGDVMNLLASCLRGAIIAPPGRDLLSADYAAIEARIALWLADAQSALEVFKRGDDIYCDMSSGIYGYRIVKNEKDLKKYPDAKIAKVINSTGATQRDFGKVAILGLGYEMGYLKFLLTLRTYNIYLTRQEVAAMMGRERLLRYEKIIRKKLFPNPKHYEDQRKFRMAEREAKIARRRLADERENPYDVIHELALCKFTVETYRERYSEVKAAWRAVEAAAIKAVLNPGVAVRWGHVTYKVVGRFLKCRLPSGRCLHYADPHVVKAKTSWGDVKPSLRFWGIDQKTKQWVRQASYGGKLFENMDQGIARDILAHAKIKLWKEYRDIFDLLFSIHDQIVVETDELETEDEREEQEKLFETVMSDLPAQYAGCPITAEAERYKRFRK